MQGSIAQIIALTNWGNSYLRQDIDLGKEKFYPGNSAFDLSRDVTFATVDKVSGQEEEYAPDPIAWLKKLKEQKCQRLRLHYRPSEAPEVPDRASVGLIGGGGRWFIEAVKVVTSDYWEADWLNGKVDNPEEKGWKVVYKLVSANEPVNKIEFRSSLEELNSHLAKHLKIMSDFARKHKQDKFADIFEEGIKIAEEGKDPLKDTPHPDILYQDHYSVKAHRALASVQKVWVFGGKGSWNDVMLEDDADHKEYEELSEALFVMLVKAAVYTVNAGFLPK